MRARWRTFGSFFLGLQAFACIVWWITLMDSPSFRGLFGFADDAALLPFFMGDMAVYALASLVAGIGSADDARWTLPWLCVHIGAAAYAEAQVISLGLTTGGGWLGAVAMGPPLVVSVWLALKLYRADSRGDGT